MRMFIMNVTTDLYVEALIRCILEFEFAGTDSDQSFNLDKDILKKHVVETSILSSLIISCQSAEENAVFGGL